MRTDVDAAIARVLDSGVLIGGPEISAFERELVDAENYAGAREVLPALRAEVERWIRAADVVCQPSLVEPFGQALLEAMASGTPVVSVDELPDGQIDLALDDAVIIIENEIQMNASGFGFVTAERWDPESVMPVLCDAIAAVLAVWMTHPRAGLADALGAERVGEQSLQAEVVKLFNGGGDGEVIDFLQADEGADLDFLRGMRGAAVPKDNH